MFYHSYHALAQNVPAGQVSLSSVMQVDGIGRDTSEHAVQAHAERHSHARDQFCGVAFVAIFSYCAIQREDDCELQRRKLQCTQAAR
jgi:hypothetical protein